MAIIQWLRVSGTVERVVWIDGQAVWTSLSRITTAFDGLH
jgi:hypothetical protein